MSATDDLYRSYLDLRWNFDPAAATAAGDVREDRRLGSFDVQSMRAHLAAFRALAGAVETLDVEDLQEEIDRTAFLDEIRITVLRFEHEKPHVHNPGFWLHHLFRAFHGLLVRSAEADPARAESVLERLRATPAFLQAAHETLKDPPRIFLDTAISMAAGGRSLLLAATELAATEDPDLSPELDSACAEAERALEQFSRALGSELRVHPDDQSFAIGEEQFNRRLHHEHALRSTAPELYRYGLHLVEEVTGEIAELARTIDPTAPWRTVVDRLRERHPLGSDPVAAMREAMERAQNFVVRRELVTMPDGELEVVPTPSFLEPLVPFAAYEPPAVFGPERIGRFYVSAHAGLSESHDPCRLEIGATALHEGYPGHHVQLLAAQASPSLVRRLTATPITVEGWALYCEELMAEQGFFEGPAEQLFQRLHLLWRAVRIVVDIGLHTRGLTPDQATDELVERLGMDRTKAALEVSRYCAWPTYQLCYAVGRRELLRLRADIQAREGAAFSLRAFHDALLTYGGLPVSLIRWGMGLEE
jgi:uncharacterized protein (DUF885 family)